MVPCPQCSSQRSLLNTHCSSLWTFSSPRREVRVETTLPPPSDFASAQRHVNHTVTCGFHQHIQSGESFAMAIHYTMLMLYLGLDPPPWSLSLTTTSRSPSFPWRYADFRQQRHSLITSLEGIDFLLVIHFYGGMYIVIGKCVSV